MILCFITNRYANFKYILCRIFKNYSIEKYYYLVKKSNYSKYVYLGIAIDKNMYNIICNKVNFTLL